MYREREGARELQASAAQKAAAPQTGMPAGKSADKQQRSSQARDSGYNENVEHAIVRPRTRTELQPASLIRQIHHCGEIRILKCQAPAAVRRQRKIRQRTGEENPDSESRVGELAEMQPV